MEITLEISDDIYEIPYMLLERNKEKLLDRGGVYLIYDKRDTLLYVGQSKNLFGRLNDHLQGRGNSRLFYEDIHYFHVYFIENGYEREMFETYAIHHLAPAYNRSKVFEKTLTDSQYEVEAKVQELRVERRDIVSEIIEAKDSFGASVYYGATDIEHEPLTEWGDILRNEQRVKAIDSEIKVLRKRH